jgi:aminoacrylate hydrolase
VLLVTGLGGVGAGWRPQISRFAEWYRTIVPDHRGAGRTAAPPHGYTVAQLAADMVGLLRSLDVEPAHVVGSSLGGAIAMVMALEHPDTVRSLVLASTCGRTDPYVERLFGLRRRILAELGHEAFVQHTMLLLLHSPAFLHEHWDAFQVFEQQLRSSPPDPQVQLARLDMVIAHDVLDRLREIRVPATILAGELDIVIPPYLSEELARHLPQARLHLVPGAGHSVYAERPDAFFEIVRGFLEGTGGGPCVC